MHDNQQPTEQTCCKTRYANKKEAQTAINRRMRGRQRRRNGSPDFLLAYHCPTCNAWHLSHLEDWFQRPPKKHGNPRRYRTDDPADYEAEDYL